MNADRFSVQGQRILITGASSGLGQHFARTLAAGGARLALAARRVERLKNLADELGGEPLTIALDVTKSDQVDAAMARVKEAFGGLDGLVNNAGVARPKPAMDLSEADWDFIVDTNLKGAWLVAQGAARLMIENGEAGYGKIINIGSVAGFRSAGQLAPYCASKAGLLHLTRALAAEWARFGIRVNALAPGYILTDMNREFFASPQGQAVIKRIPQRRLGAVTDLDGPLLLLASPASDYVTGAVLTVDGGHSQSAM